MMAREQKLVRLLEVLAIPLALLWASDALILKMGISKFVAVPTLLIIVVILMTRRKKDGVPSERP